VNEKEIIENKKTIEIYIYVQRFNFSFAEIAKMNDVFPVPGGLKY